MPPLFVVGCHRSGTTLLRRILCTHPEVWLARETQYLAALPLSADAWHRDRSDDALREHLDWVAPFLRATGWVATPSVPAFLASDAPRTWAGAYAWLCGLERPRPAAWWGDNTPRYVSLVPQLEQGFPGARYLHLVRDPRDVVRSALAVPFGGNTALTAAEEWVERVGAGLAAAQLVGDRLLCVRYEDLVTAPGPVLARIAAWLGIDDAFRPDDLGGDAASVASQAHLARVAQPLDGSRVGQWRQALSEAEVADVEQLCQPFLAAFGYEGVAWRPAWDPTPRFARYARGYARSLAVNLARGARRRLGR
ncbi:MAG: sulfotransferase [Myxococcota bacterium]